MLREIGVLGGGAPKGALETGGAAGSGSRGSAGLQPLSWRLLSLSPEVAL